VQAIPRQRERLGRPRLQGRDDGRAEKGLVITTGGFTRDARQEATRDGATAIDLIDGDLLADKLKELGLGVRTKMVEAVEIDDDWFTSV
jgi:restriction system protein